MARDRLAETRRQQQGGYQQQSNSGYVQQNDYRTTAPQASVPQQRSGGYVPQGGYSQQDSYASQPQQQQQGRYAQPSQPDMRQTQGGYGAPPPPGSANQLSPSSGGEDEETKFFNDISDIQKATRDLNGNIDRIADLHSRQLGAVANEQEHAAITAQLAEMTQETRRFTNSLKNGIKRLEGQTSKRDPRDPNTNVRRTQVGAVKNRFLETIQRYQQVEQESRKKHRQRMERQYKIVKPEASQQEVNAALDDTTGGNNRVFEQALLNSNRYGDARAAFKEVQDRHVEIVKIEQTITELAQMFNDMAMMVDEQDVPLQAVEAKAQEAETDMQAAEGQMQKAVKSARAARKKRWICFIVILIILIAVGIGLAVHFTQNK